jgi:hypothetical protein
VVLPQERRAKTFVSARRVKTFQGFRARVAIIADCSAIMHQIAGCGSGTYFRHVDFRARKENASCARH